MEEMQLITRCGAESDGRGVEIVLTKKGSEALELCRPLVEKLNDHFTAKLANGDLQEVLANIDTLSAGETRQLSRL